MWEGHGPSDARAIVRPEGATPAPSRSTTAAASQSDSTRRAGGST